MPYYKCPVCWKDKFSERPQKICGACRRAGKTFRDAREWEGGQE